MEATVVNAVELSWTPPHEVPADRTEVAIDCVADTQAADNLPYNGGTAGAIDADSFVDNDPLSIY